MKELWIFRLLILLWQIISLEFGSGQFAEEVEGSDSSEEFDEENDEETSDDERESQESKEQLKEKVRARLKVIFSSLTRNYQCCFIFWEFRFRSDVSKLKLNVRQAICDHQSFVCLDMSIQEKQRCWTRYFNSFAFAMIIFCLFFLVLIHLICLLSNRYDVQMCKMEKLVG